MSELKKERHIYEKRFISLKSLIFFSLVLNLKKKEQNDRYKIKYNAESRVKKLSRERLILPKKMRYKKPNETRFQVLNLTDKLAQKIEKLTSALAYESELRMQSQINFKKKLHKLINHEVGHE